MESVDTSLSESCAPETNPANVVVDSDNTVMVVDALVNTPVEEVTTSTEESVAVNSDSVSSPPSGDDPNYDADTESSNNNDTPVSAHVESPVALQAPPNSPVTNVSPPLPKKQRVPKYQPYYNRLRNNEKELRSHFQGQWIVLPRRNAYKKVFRHPQVYKTRKSCPTLYGEIATLYKVFRELNIRPQGFLLSENKVFPTRKLAPYGYVKRLDS